ncbi:MAG: transcription activator effector-binding protein [Bacteroidetes bacterium]|nr:MAG: transcription activator effector-binding protein [Bacteroidota bacterium]
MKSLKYLLFLLLILAIGFSIYIAVQPNSFNVTRAKTIKAPAAVIYNNVIDFKNWESWSSWAEADPDMSITLHEKTNGINGSYSWEDKDGIGIMKTVDAVPNTSINQQMQIEDFPTSDVSWNFKPNEDGSTEVTWNISGKDLPFMFKAFATVMGGMEKQIAPHYERSLEKLDSIVINSMKAFNVNINGITEYGGGFYLYKTINATNTNISQVMGLQYGSISMFMEQNNISFAGMPFTIYHDMNMENGAVIMSNAIPVKEKIVITGNSEILCDYQPKMKVLKATLKGNYTNLGEAWKTTMQYIDDNNIEQSEHKPFEIYTTDPGQFPNPADWITEIYIPIKE